MSGCGSGGLSSKERPHDQGDQGNEDEELRDADAEDEDTLDAAELPGSGMSVQVIGDTACAVNQPMPEALVTSSGDASWADR